MKAFLLAAGQGTRLKPLTDSTPKCLLPIQGEPLLGLWLKLCRLHGITDVLINTHLHSAAVAEFTNKNNYGLKICITKEKTLLGSAGTLFANQDWVRKDPEFWILYADVLTNANLSKMLEYHRHLGPCATMGVYQVGNPTECGIVSVDETGIVREFVEKPTEPASNLAFSGLMVATSKVLEFLPSTAPADIGFHVLPKLVGRMAAFRISDYLVDVGTPAKYAHVQQSWPGFSPPMDNTGAQR